MSDKTSENFKLSKLEERFEKKYYKCKVGVEFREYLANLIAREFQNLNFKELENFVKNIVSEIEILKFQASESLNDYEKTRKMFRDSIEESSDTKLPEEILKLGDEAVVIIDNAEEKRKECLNQSTLCDEFLTFVKKIEKLIINSNSIEVKKIFEELLEILALERADQVIKLESLKAEYNDLDKKSMAAICEVMDATDSFLKGHYRFKQKE